MSLFLRRLGPNNILLLARALNAPQIKQCHWFPDFKPGPYPKTKEEREAAAQKYNLLPEEYEPYPDDGSGSGDYPALPALSVDLKDPYYNWDYMQLRRDFMEPAHRDLMFLLPESPSVGGRPKISLKKRVAAFIGSVFTFFVVYYLFNRIVLITTITEKQYPFKGEKHYTFELQDVPEEEIIEEPECSTL